MTAHRELLRQQMLCLRAAGLGNTEIAGQFECSVKWVRDIIGAETDCRSEAARLSWRRATPEQRAARAAHSHASRGFRQWTAEEDDAIRAVYLFGGRISVLATRLGVTRNAVIGRAYRLGLKHPTPMGSSPWVRCPQAADEAHVA